MATTYTVALQNKVSGEAQKALADVERLTAALGAAEQRRARPSFSPPSGRDWERTAAAAQRAADKERTAQLRLNAEAMRSAQQMEDAKRNAAFRRLQAQQREEERFTRYKIGLMRKEAAEQARLDKQRAAFRPLAAHTPGGGIGGMAGGLIAGGVGAAAVGAAAYVGGQAVDAVKLIEASRMRLTASLGSADRAAREMKDAFRIAEKTVFDPDEMVNAMAKLSTYFKDDETRRYVLGAISDFATQSGTGTEGLNRAIKAVSDVKSKGTLQAEELKNQLGDLGLSATAVYNEVAEILHLKGKTDEEKAKQVQDLMRKAQVSADVGVQAITAAMRKQAGGGKAGEFSIKSAGTLEGQLSNIRKGLLTLFAMADIDKWPAMESLKKALGDIGGLFATDSKEGAKMMAAVKSYTSGLATIFGVVAKAMWAISYPARLVVELVGQAMDAIGDYNFQGLFDMGAWKRLGTDMVLGIVEGVKNAASYLYTTFTEVAGGAVTAVRDKLGIRSPSRVMMEQGAYTAQGFALGLEKGASQIQAAGRGLADLEIAPTTTISPRGGMAANGAGLNVTFQNTFQVGAAQDAAAFVREVGPLLETQAEMAIDRVFGRYVAQGAG